MRKRRYQSKTKVVEEEDENVDFGDQVDEDEENVDDFGDEVALPLKPRQAAARSSRSRTPSHSGVSGGSWTQICMTP